MSFDVVVILLLGEARGDVRLDVRVRKGHNKHEKIGEIGEKIEKNDDRESA